MTFDVTEFSVGQRVRLLCDIYEEADDHAPGGYCARRGELLVVRRIKPDAKCYPVSVSHEDITDNSFGVSASEIALEAIGAHR